jgi:DNA topoisomerase-2
VLQRAEDEGEAIEPVCYAPVIPMLLVNGGQGIGTGFSSLVPPFHPLDVIENIRFVSYRAHVA